MQCILFKRLFLVVKLVIGCLMTVTFGLHIRKRHNKIQDGRMHMPIQLNSTELMSRVRTSRYMHCVNFLFLVVSPMFSLVGLDHISGSTNALTLCAMAFTCSFIPPSPPPPPPLQCRGCNLSVFSTLVNYPISLTFRLKNIPIFMKTLTF